jgi:hypothetical protein
MDHGDAGGAEEGREKAESKCGGREAWRWKRLPPPFPTVGQTADPPHFSAAHQDMI